MCAAASTMNTAMSTRACEFHSKSSAADALARRDAFDESWWLDRCNSADGLIIDFERA